MADRNFLALNDNHAEFLSSDEAMIELMGYSGDLADLVEI